MSNQLSTTFAQPGTSPKQQNPFPQPGRLSPGTIANISKNYAQPSSGNRKSLTSTKLEVNNSCICICQDPIGMFLFLFSFFFYFKQKRAAPIPPNQTMYSTLPHAPRHSQSVDAKDIRGINKMQSDMYSTLPHVRNSDAKTSLDLHFNNKIYEPLPFEAEIETADKYEKQKYSQQPSEFTTFGHKRSLSGESIGRNLHLAGAKLVLPSGEIPVLKPVDKNVIRPKLPPPGPPPHSVTTPSSHPNNGSYKSYKINEYQFN